jgi:hypothetical protein
VVSEDLDAAGSECCHLGHRPRMINTG